jgi:uncharacterized membrane protein
MLIPTAWGLAAGTCWAATNVLLSRTMRSTNASSATFWFSLVGAMLAGACALPVYGLPHVSPGDVGLLMSGGLAGAASTGLLNRALRVGAVSLVAPLVSLEGLAAAMMSLVFGVRLTGAIVVGALCAALGSVLISGRESQRASTQLWIPMSLGAAVTSGVALWTLGQQAVAALWAVSTMRGVGALAVAPAILGRQPAAVRQLPVALPMAAAADVAGNLCFISGTRAGSTAATAICAAQFGPLSALGGWLFLGESIRIKQIWGLVLIAAAVGLIATRS